MKKQFNKIHKSVMELATIMSSKTWEDFTEDELDILAESMDTLNDLYEKLYDKVFVK